MEISTRPLLMVGDLDREVAALQEHAQAWARLGLTGRIRHLRTMRARTVEVAPAWVDLAARAKGIANTPLAGEEWFAGPYALLIALDRLIATLGEIAVAGSPRVPSSLRMRADGQLVVDVFPVQSSDRVLLSGVRGELWMEPSVTRESLPVRTAGFYHRSDPAGSVTLVLGAGNIASIAPLDVLNVLYTHGGTAFLKLNPVNAYLLPVFERVFASLIDEGYLRIAGGGPDVGAYLCAHPGIDAIHLTGGERTHDAIVFGTGAEGAARKRAATPLLTKPVTSELGNVTPDRRARTVE
jgi:hypothetical protein